MTDNFNQETQTGKVMETVSESKMLIIPKEIWKISEDGSEEITLADAIEYCGEDAVRVAMENGKNCNLNDMLEFSNSIKMIF